MYLILDIETVPDTEVWTPEKKARGGGDAFPPVYAHRPVAIGHVILGDDLSTQSVGCIGDSTYKGDERKMLSDLHAYLSDARPTIVTWNGRGFDVPVIAMRSMRWGLPVKWLDKDTRYKYGEDRHMDLMEMATDYGTVGRAGFRLDNIARMIGLPGKCGIDGSEVAAYYAAGKCVEIERYCVSDVLMTAGVLLRFLLLRGRIDQDAYRVAATNLLDRAKSIDWLTTFVENTNEKRFLLTE
jgi:predicted PolB exonuclease-like 3'-5' exonuclease